MRDFVVCVEMSAWVPAVSEGGWNILRTETRTSPISRAVVDFLEKGETITADRYVQTLNKFRCVLSEKRPRREIVFLQRDNARPHTARLTLQTIEKNHWELLSHQPSIPDLSPSDYRLFGSLKDRLRGLHYDTDEAVQEAVRNWLGGAGTDFYRRGIFKILQRWKRCWDRDGDFIEK